MGLFREKVVLPRNIFCTVRGLSPELDPTPPSRLKPRSELDLFRLIRTLLPVGGMHTQSIKIGLQKRLLSSHIFITHVYTLMQLNQYYYQIT